MIFIYDEVIYVDDAEYIDKEKPAMATSGKLDWRGCPDGTPPARPTDPDKAPERSHASGDSWKGLDDGTPSAKPTAPDKE